MPKSKPSYESLKDELDEVLLSLQQENLDVDEAMKYYERGLELVEALEKYLKTAENKIIELKAKSKSKS